MAQLEIYIAMHKPYRAAEDAAYRPLQVGAALNAPFGEYRDDEGENISEKNRSFCEVTGLYWMWKHSRADIVGLVHYRRYFADAAFWRKPWARILSGARIERMLGEVDILLPKKRHYVIETNYSQYVHAHHEKDIQLARSLIGETCPTYLAAFDRVMARRSGHRFNMFVMKRALFDAYCGWLFPLLFELEKRIDTTGYDAYNRRVIGFIAERLLDIWLDHEQAAYVEAPVVDIEPVNWGKKGLSFVRRKLVGTIRPHQDGLRNKG